MVTAHTKVGLTNLNTNLRQNPNFVWEHPLNNHYHATTVNFHHDTRKVPPQRIPFPSWRLRQDRVGLFPHSSPWKARRCRPDFFKKIILQLILTKKNGDVWELVTVPGSCPCQGLQRRSCPQRSCPRRRRTGWCMRCKPSLYHLFSNAWVMHSPLKSAVVTESLVWASHSSSEMMLTWIIFSNWQLNDFSKKKPSPPLPAGHLGSRQGRRPEIPNLV